MTDAEQPTRPPESRICHECGTTIAAGVDECPRCALEGQLGSKGFEVDLEALAAELPQLEILEEIGRGGMGEVLRGPGLGVRVVDERLSRYAESVTLLGAD